MKTILIFFIAAITYAQTPVVGSGSGGAVVAGSPPGGIGGACDATAKVGYLDASGNLITCPSGTSVWTVTGSGGSAPTGPAGGALSGTYPDPGVADPLPLGNVTASGIVQIGDPLPLVPFWGGTSGLTTLSSNVGGEFVGSGLNDMYVDGTSGYTGSAPAVFVFQINTTGTPDTFVWKKNSGSFSSPISITSGSMLISQGLSVLFDATTGHTAGDQWIIPTAAGLLWSATLYESTLTGATAALAGAGSGNVTNGVHGVKITWATSNGDTYAYTAGSVTVANNAANGKILVSSIPQSTSALWIGTNIWMTKAGGSAYYLVGFAPRGTTSFTVNRADGSMSMAAPYYWDSITTAGGCVYGEDAGLGAGQCALQFFDYGLRFPSNYYFFDHFPNGLLGTSGNQLIQLTALPNGTTATTQSQADNSNKPATTAYVDTLGATKAASNATVTVGGSSCALGGSCAPSVSVNGTTCTLGSSCSPSGGSGSAATPYLTIDGANFFGPVFAVTKPPSIASLTWVNQGTATATATSGGAITMVAQTHSGDDLKFLHTSSYPSTPYTFTIGFIPQYNIADFYCQGIAISDGTKFFVAGMGSNAGVGTCYYTHATATSSGSTVGAFSARTPYTRSVWFISLTDDGTNISVTAGPDLSQMISAGTITRTSLSITPTQVGIFVNTNNTNFTSSALFFHWAGI